MKCLICNKELTGNVCERCGFPKISVVGGAEDDPVVKTAVHDYKENILKKITVEMETYQYKEDGNKLDKDQCTWFQEDFARMEAGEPMTLTLFINNDGREVRREISLKAPDIRSFWKAGLKSQGGMDYTVVLGTADRYAETESFCILDK